MARLALAVGLVTVATVLAEATGCSSTSSNQGAADGSTMTPDGKDGAALDAGGPADCVAAGGQCLVGGGGDICAVVGPQDCNPDRGPSGSYCCLEKASGVDAAADTGADSSPDASSDAADACAPSGCATSCPRGTRDVSTVVDGCTVWQCCVPDDAGADGATDAGPADAGGE